MSNIRIIAIRTTATTADNVWDFFRSILQGRKRVKIDPYGEPSWSEKGWIKEGTVFRGTFKTRFGKWDGMIADRAGVLEVFINSPPKQLRKHPRWHCWQNIGKGEIYKLHIIKEAESVGSTILNVENMLAESFRL